MVPLPLVHVTGRTQASSWQAPLQGVTWGFWFWSSLVSDSITLGISWPVLLGWEQDGLPCVVTGQEGAGVDGSGLFLGGHPVPCTVRSSRASSPRCVPVSPIDIPETLVSQAVAGLTSSSSSQGGASDLHLDGSCQQGRRLAGLSQGWGASSSHCCDIFGLIFSGCKGGTHFLEAPRGWEKSLASWKDLWPRGWKCSHCSCSWETRKDRFAPACPQDPETPYRWTECLLSFPLPLAFSPPSPLHFSTCLLTAPLTLWASAYL